MTSEFSFISLEPPKLSFDTRRIPKGNQPNAQGLCWNSFHGLREPINFEKVHRVTTDSKVFQKIHLNSLKSGQIYESSYHVGWFFKSWLWFQTKQYQEIFIVIQFFFRSSTIVLEEDTSVFNIGNFGGFWNSSIIIPNGVTSWMWMGEPYRKLKSFFHPPGKPVCTYRL